MELQRLAPAATLLHARSGATAIPTPTLTIIKSPVSKNNVQTVGLISLGCPKNLVDSEVMLGLLEAAGYAIVQDPGRADVLIVNTCSFIEDAKKESVDTILEMAGYKVKGKCQRLVVTGCLPQRYKDELLQLLPEVDLFVGTGEYQKIVDMLSTARQHDSKAARQHISPPQYIHTSKTPRKIATTKHAVYLKIAEGCFHSCSFCIIPKLRGGFRSRLLSDVVEEAKILLASGAKELNLIAQDTTSYGRDLDSGTNLARLLESLNKLPGEKWIRFLYAYPNSITDELIETMAGLGDVCKYIDMPIQHINDRILGLMRRPEKGAQIRRIIDALRTKIPDIAIRTSLIVGFPGETRAEFSELLNFVREGHFDHLGVFTYSKEEGTVSEKFKGQISIGVKKDRQRQIMEAQAIVSKARNSKWIGKTVKVLVDGPNLGRTQGQAPEIDGVTHIKSNRADIGKFITAKIVETSEYDLVAL